MIPGPADNGEGFRYRDFSPERIFFKREYISLFHIIVGVTNKKQDIYLLFCGVYFFPVVHRMGKPIGYRSPVRC
jgi:hypothetical protein